MDPNPQFKSLSLCYLKRSLGVGVLLLGFYKTLFLLGKGRVGYLWKGWVWSVQLGGSWDGQIESHMVRPLKAPPPSPKEVFVKIREKTRFYPGKSRTTFIYRPLSGAKGIQSTFHSVQPMSGAMCVSEVDVASVQPDTCFKELMGLYM